MARRELIDCKDLAEILTRFEEETLALSRDGEREEVEALRQKLRMIVSHATGGATQDMDASINDICVEISRHVNRVWEHAQEVALATPKHTREAAQDGERDRLATALEGYAKASGSLHRDIADDFRSAAAIIRSASPYRDCEGDLPISPDGVPSTPYREDLIPESNAGVREAIARAVDPDPNVWMEDGENKLERERITRRRVGAYAKADQILSLLPASIDVVGKAREALEAVQGAMLNGGDGVVGDFGWNITKLNKARPLIRTALASLTEKEGS